MATKKRSKAAWKIAVARGRKAVSNVRAQTSRR